MVIIIIHLYSGLGLIYFFVAVLIVWVFCCCRYCKTKNTNNNRPNINNYQQARLLSDNSIHRIDSIDGADRNNNNGNNRNLPLPLPLPVNNEQEQEQQENIEVNENAIKLTFCASCFRYFLSFLSIMIIIFCLFIGYKLDSTIINVQTNWDNSYEPYDICINYGHSIEHTLTSAINQCDKILHKTSFPPSCQPYEIAIKNITSSIEDQIKDSLNIIDSYLDDGEKLNWGNSSTIDNYRKYSIYVGLSILSLMAIIILISTFCTKALSTMTKCICCNSFLSVILVFGMLLIWIISSWQFAFSVQVSDACNNPQDSILQGVNITNNNNNIDETTIEIVEYYIYCNNKYPTNPLYNYTQSALIDLQSLNSTIQLVLPYAKDCDITNETNILLKDYNKTLSQLNTVEKALQCNDINNYLTNITTDLCDDGINYWYLLYASQVFVIFLLIIRSFCICTKSEIDYDNNNHYNVIVQNSSSVNDENNADNPYQIMSNPLSSPVPNFSDKDVRKCIKYLLQFSDDLQLMEKKGKELEKTGYDNSGIPLHEALVKKSIAILKNYQLNQDSKFIHPLLRGLV